MTSAAPVRIATRGSLQARTQAGAVAAAITRANPDLTVELVFVETLGDQRQDVPLHTIGGQGVFVKEVQRAVLDGRADLAAHSAKDLPSASADGLIIGAFCARRSPADALVGTRLSDLAPGATVATGSVRRRAQLAAARPDLLLVGALLHDIGKGHPGDHTEVGMDLVDVIGPRMGFPDDDVRVLRLLVEHHLLLAETATRRDLSDPRTAALVAEAVGDIGSLQLLKALTEADSRATGPSAWSPWKASLIDQLISTVTDVLHGTEGQLESRSAAAHLNRLLQVDGVNRELHLEHETDGDFDMVRIVSRDRRGLFSVIAGTLSLHGLDVVGADAFTAEDGTVLDEFRILRSQDRVTNWVKVEHDLRAAIAGELDIDARLEQRIKSYGRSRSRAMAAAPPRLEVLISNDASVATTVVEVRAPDGAAVLYRLSHSLSLAGIDIRSAKVATLGHEVVDVFYATTPESADGKVPSSRHDELRALLRDSLQPA
jgi:[protein-PII] uridylyltransferase